jgi:hypothetical protein
VEPGYLRVSQLFGTRANCDDRRSQRTVQGMPDRHQVPDGRFVNNLSLSTTQRLAFHLDSQRLVSAVVDEDCLRL